MLDWADYDYTNVEIINNAWGHYGSSVFLLEFVPQKPMPGKFLVQLTWQLTNDS